MKKINVERRTARAKHSIVETPVVGTFLFVLHEDTHLSLSLSLHFKESHSGLLKNKKNLISSA